MLKDLKDSKAICYILGGHALGNTFNRKYNQKIVKKRKFQNFFENKLNGVISQGTVNKLRPILVKNEYLINDPEKTIHNIRYKANYAKLLEDLLIQFFKDVENDKLNAQKILEELKKVNYTNDFYIQKLEEFANLNVKIQCNDEEKEYLIELIDLVLWQNLITHSNLTLRGLNTRILNTFSLNNITVYLQFELLTTVKLTDLGTNLKKIHNYYQQKQKTGVIL